MTVRLQANSETALDMLQRAAAGAPAGSPLLVKALMSQASVLQSLARQPEALEVVRQASRLDPSIVQKFLEPMEAQLGSQ